MESAHFKDRAHHALPGANHSIFVKTDMVCYKWSVGFLRQRATTSEWTKFLTEIQDEI